MAEDGAVFIERWREMVREARPEIRRLAKRGAIYKDPVWPVVIGLFLECWRADHPGIRKRTLDHYEEQLRRRLAKFAYARGVRSPLQFTRDHLRSFVTWVEDYQQENGKPLAPRGKQMALDNAKRFFRWLHSEGLIPADITEGVASFKLPRNIEPRATSEESFERLLTAFDKDTDSGIRDLAMVYLMAWCGLRVGELVGLNVGDIDIDEKVIRIPAEITKGRASRTVPLPLTERDGRPEVVPEVAEVLFEWLGAVTENFPDAGDDGPLFATIGVAPSKKGGFIPRGRRLTDSAVRTILGRAAERVGIDSKEVMPHRLRHHFGVASHMAGVPMTALAKAMGHRTLAMTARYAAMTDRETETAFARADITNGARLPGRKRSWVGPKERRRRLEREGRSTSERSRQFWGRKGE